MAIKIIYGRGGSGKSFFQMHVIIKQLRETRRNIVTNLAINIPAFNAYLEKHFPNEDLNLIGRLRILTPDETFEFWKYRGPFRWTGNEYDREEDKGAFGVCYIIDEAGASGFGAAGWAAKVGVGTRGERCVWYLDQQRKFSDDVFASTNGRLPTAIAKPFRDKAHGFLRLKNGYLTTYGPFKGRGRFEWAEFTQEPTGQAVESIAEGTFTLGELADCYRTQDGVGGIGNAADKGQRAKGIPILWVIPGALVLASLCVMIPWALGRGAQHYIGGTAPAEKSTQEAGGRFEGVTGAGASIGGVVAPRIAAADGAASPLPSPVPAILSDNTPERPLYVTGYVVGGGKINVQLSDGRTLTELDTELIRVNRNSVQLKEGKLWMNRKTPPAPVTAVNSVAPVVPAEPSPAPLPPAPESEQSSWQTHADGITRLTPTAAALARQPRLQLQ